MKKKSIKLGIYTNIFCWSSAYVAYFAIAFALTMFLVVFCNKIPTIFILVLPLLVILLIKLKEKPYLSKMELFGDKLSIYQINKFKEKIVQSFDTKNIQKIILKIHYKYEKFYYEFLVNNEVILSEILWEPLDRFRNFNDYKIYSLLKDLPCFECEIDGDRNTSIENFKYYMQTNKMKGPNILFVSIFIFLVLLLVVGVVLSIH